MPEACTLMGTQSELAMLQAAFERVRDELAKCVCGLRFADRAADDFAVSWRALSARGTSGRWLRPSRRLVSRSHGTHIRSSAQYAGPHATRPCRAGAHSREMIGKLQGRCLRSWSWWRIFERLSPRSDALIQQAIQEQQVVLDGQQHALSEAVHDRRDAVSGSQRHKNGPSERSPTSITTIASCSKSRLRTQTKPMNFGWQPPCRPLPRHRFSKSSVIDEIRRFRALIREDQCFSPGNHRFILRLVRSTRIHEGETPDFIYEWVELRTAPRATRRKLPGREEFRAALNGRDNSPPMMSEPWRIPSCGIASSRIETPAHPVLR